jgi:hypothetical protein
MKYFFFLTIQRLTSMKLRKPFLMADTISQYNEHKRDPSRVSKKVKSSI